MSNKASIANLLNDNATSYVRKNTFIPYSYNNKMNIIPSRFTTNFGGISSSQPHHPLSTTTTSDAAFTDFMECPNLPQSDTTIINGVQIVTNDDPSSSSPPRTQPPQEEFTENNWLPPLHPRYSYDSPPKMPIYKKSKKKGQANDNDTDDANSSTIRSKRNYTKKPLDRLKRPRNGYMIYMNEVYEDVKRKYPNLKFGELSTQIGIQWKNMTKTEQMPYHQRHEEEKNAYESAKLAMSRSNLQIVEETIGIERQVKAAELKAFELIAAKNKKENKVETKVVEETRQLSQSETPSSRPPPNYGDVAPCIPKPGNSLSVGSNEINQKVITSHYPKGNNAFRHNEKPPTGNGPRKSDAAPSTVLRKLKPKPDIPITPISPDFSNRALQLAMPKTPSLTTLAQENARSIRRNFLSPAREAQRVNYFKQHFPDLNVEDERKNERMECEGVSTPQSVGGSVVEDVEQSEMKNLESDDDEEKIDQLLPSDQSDTEMEGIEISNASPSSTRKSPDTSTIWYLPIKGTIVSSGLTPFRKRKVIRTEDSEEEVEPKRFKENRISQIDEII